MPPTYSIKAFRAIGHLKKSQNDIEIYIEDSSIANAYNFFIRNLLPKHVRFSSVIAIGSREKVLEAYTGTPQEVEFVIESGRLYFLQTRRMEFGPQAKVKYLQDQMAAGKMSEARAIPQLERLQDHLKDRRFFRVREGAPVKEIARALASTR